LNYSGTFIGAIPLKRRRGSLLIYSLLFLTLFDRYRTHHAALLVIAHRTVKFVSAGVEVHLEQGALAGRDVFGFFLDPFSLDLEGVLDFAGVRGPKEVRSGPIQGNLSWVQAELGFLYLDRVDRLFGSLPNFAFGFVGGVATGSQCPKEDRAGTNRDNAFELDNGSPPQSGTQSTYLSYPTLVTIMMQTLYQL
jgi:hypothetical protein